MTKKYDYAVFIGRFSPCHFGHLAVIARALQEAETLIMVVGSANASRNTRNLFTVAERIEMLRLMTDNNPRIEYVAVNDHPYDDPAWISEVQSSVNVAIGKHAGWSDYPKSIALIGMKKDATSYYLNIFPQWAAIDVKPWEVHGNVMSATTIRELLLRESLSISEHARSKDNYYIPGIALKVNDYLVDHIANNWQIWFDRRSDWKYENEYEDKWGEGPHVTVDSLVTQSGHLLLIQRGNEYGHALWALPGGFVNRNEKLRHAAVRELREETELKVPEKVLFGSMGVPKVFDDPYRSNRSRIITHVFPFELENCHALPKVKGSDDAMNAKWVPYGELSSLRGQFFEDHGSIIGSLLKINDI